VAALPTVLMKQQVARAEHAAEHGACGADSQLPRPLESLWQLQLLLRLLAEKERHRAQRRRHDAKRLRAEDGERLRDRLRSL
jgi:hypothetical protein